MTTVRARPALGLGSVLLLALLAASIGVAAYVYHARTPNLALEVTLLDRKFAPSADGKGQHSRISYFVRDSDSDATVEIVGRNKVVIRTISADAPIEANRQMMYSWNGLDDQGELTMPGRYRLRVILPGSARDMVFPRRITVEPEPFKPESSSGSGNATQGGGAGK